jgi:hypothetical protein
MSKWFIQQLSSPFTVPVLRAKKLDGRLRLCKDYRDINSKMIQNLLPLPLIEETFDLSVMAQIYTKLDVGGAYN